MSLGAGRPASGPIGRLPLVAALDARAQTIASEIGRRRVDDGRLDVRATAAELGVVLVEADLGDYLLAATFGDTVVLNSSDWIPSGRSRFAFAHELGHVLIGRGVVSWVERSREEWWADLFAHELIFPRRWLRDRASWQQLRLFDEPSESRTTALHLAALDGAPEVFVLDGVVLCAACGEEPFFYDCRCRQFHEDPVARERLLHVRPPCSIHLDQLRLFGDANVSDLLDAWLCQGTETQAPACPPDTGSFPATKRQPRHLQRRTPPARLTVCSS